MKIDDILWLAAAVMFAVQALIPQRRVHLGWLGLACVALTFVL